MSLWDTALWDRDTWDAGPPPGPGWGTDWSWWLQHSQTVVRDLTPYIVEARWSTDSHTLGDGSFRGDLQPGSATIRLWDPLHVLDNFDKTATVWAQYKPTGATWCYYYDTFTRGLVAPGDPAGADCVFTGTTWPARLMSPLNLGPGVTWPIASVSSRLATMLANLQANRAALVLPTYGGDIAAQSQQVSATVADQYGHTPSYLAIIRDAAAPGVAWLSAASRLIAGFNVGELMLHYSRWETANPTRVLDRSQIVSGPAVTADIDWVITWTRWTATNGATGANTLFDSSSSQAVIMGYQGPSPLRMWGNIANGGPELAACNATGNQLNADRGDGSQQTLSSVDVQSGRRTRPDGSVSAATWDPYAHVFTPLDVASITNDAGQVRPYRVVKSDHRLTSTIWETTHTLEYFTAAIPLPA